MPTIQEHEAKMTLYYSKSTGEIKSYATGIHDMSAFGEDEADYSKIWDFVVVDIDGEVINNRKNFKINVQQKELRKKASAISKYPIEP